MLIIALPLLLALGFALLLPAPLVPARRPIATRTVLATSLLTTLVGLLLIRAMSHSDVLNASRILSATLAILASGLSLAPLLDRARPASLVITATFAATFLTPLLFHGFVPRLPAIGGIGLLYAVVIASVTFGLGGSWQLSRHPARYTGNIRRVLPIATTRAASGWALIALVLLALAALTTAPDAPLLLSAPLFTAATAALITLLHGRATYALVQATQALSAGLLLTLISPLTLPLALAAGVIAGMLVLRGEALAQLLRLDDPHGLLVSLLLPALFGLFLPALTGAFSLEASADWAGASLLVGAVAAAVLWPLTKLILGLADPISEPTTL